MERRSGACPYGGLRAITSNDHGESQTFLLPTISNNSLACKCAHSLSNNGSRPRSFLVSSFTLPTYAILPSSTCSNNSNPPFAYADSNAEPGCTASFWKPSAFRTPAVNLPPLAADRVSATCCGVSTSAENQ